MDAFLQTLNGLIMPLMLTVCGLVLSFKIKILRMLSPKKFIKELTSSTEGSGTSPFASLCTALAGTLGVGNIAGVATAITAGGAGAVFWMWIGALVSISVKYGEVVLAVRFRRKGKEGFYGGAMYTIHDCLSKRLGNKAAGLIGTLFAVLCVLNSLVMGNLLQANSASSVFKNGYGGTAVCLFLGAGTAAVAFLGTKKIEKAASFLIPPLSALYILLSCSVIIRNHSLIPNAFKMILTGAFTFRSAAGGAIGLGIKGAVRFGFTRGIFSNEAGCGTSPTAHAAANTRSPHKQGCFGIIEVIFDTLILCTLTALIILICQIRFGPIDADGTALTLKAFYLLSGRTAYYAVSFSVVLFAYATILAQLYYGRIALRYITRSEAVVRVYHVLMILLASVGGMVDVTLLWSAADLIVGVMTVINTSVLITCSELVRKESC